MLANIINTRIEKLNRNLIEKHEELSDKKTKKAEQKFLHFVDETIVDDEDD